MPQASRMPIAERSWRTRGRKPKLMPTPDVLRSIARFGKLNVTKRELASALGVAPCTLDAFFKTCPEAAEVFEDARAVSNVSLRRAQFKRALRGSDQMLIWLGKNQLGQTDRVAVDGDGIQPVTFQIVGLPVPAPALPQGEQNDQPAIEGAAVRIDEPRRGL